LKEGVERRQVKITLSETPERTVIALAGDDNVPQSIAELKETIERAVKRAKPIVIDITALFYLGSEGVGVIAATHRMSREADIDLVIKNPTKQVARVFMVTRLDTFLNIQRDEPGAG
jgi:anti-anti-sigma factor